MSIWEMVAFLCVLVGLTVFLASIVPICQMIYYKIKDRKKQCDDDIDVSE